MNRSELFSLLRQILEHELFAIAGTPVSVATVLIVLLILLATFRVSSLLQKGLERAMTLRGVKEPGSLGVSRRLVHYFVLLTGFGVALQTIGVDLGALFAAGAVFAVAIGFAMQNIAQNFVSGLILLMERVIKPGDVLEVEGQVVRVVDLGIRATIVRTRDEEDLIVPNTVLAQSTVTNFTFRDSLCRLRAEVGVSYSSDLRQVRAVLETAARDLPWRSTAKEPVVMLKGFGGSSVDFQVSVWTEDPWRLPQELSALHEAIWWALKDAGIVIAFPQLDVHLDPGAFSAGPDPEAPS
jgi:small-conductance mechanosensitive channel